MTGRRLHRLLAAVPLVATVVVTPLFIHPAGGQEDEDDLVAAGRELFETGCQSCHGPDGRGVDAPDGSTRGPSLENSGEAAPRLQEATPTEVGSAVRVGPGQMPVFGPEIVSDRELNDLVGYVEYLRSPADPGGIPIGRTGPIPEGFVSWLVGMVALVALVAWIGTRSPIRRTH